MLYKSKKVGQVLFGFSLVLCVLPSASYAGRLYGVLGGGYISGKPLVSVGESVIGQAPNGTVYHGVVASGSVARSNSFDGSAGVGYLFSPYFKSELLFTHFAKSSKTQPFNVQSVGILPATSSVISNALMWQIYFTPFHFQIYHVAVAPYVGSGLGMAFNRVRFEGNYAVPSYALLARSGYRPALAWDLNLGLESRVTDNVALSVGYRYINLGHAAITGANVSGNGFTSARVASFKSLGTVANSEIYANAIYYMPNDEEKDPYTKLDSVALGNTYFKLDGSVGLNSFVFNAIGKDNSFPKNVGGGNAVSSIKTARVQVSAASDVAVGNNILPWLGTEFMLSYHRLLYAALPKVDNASLGHVSGMTGYHRSIAGLINFNIHPWRAREKSFDIEPYFNVGFGLSDNRMPKMRGDINVTQGGTSTSYHFVQNASHNLSMAWMAGTGVEVRFHNHWGMVAGIRFSDLGHYVAQKAYLSNNGNPASYTTFSNRSSVLYTVEGLVGLTYHL